jgi:hypothetical protein
MKLQGTLHFRDMGAGAWVLEDASGTTHDLDLTQIDPVQLQQLEGKRVEVHGRTGGFGFGMMGAQSVTVDRISHAR